MDVVAWVLVVALVGVVVWLLKGRRPPDNPYPAALGRLAEEISQGTVATEAGDPEEVEQLRRLISEGWKPVADEPAGDPMREALDGILRYLQRTVLPALEEARALRDPEEALQDALDALDDLSFYAAPERAEVSRKENLSQIVQSVTREYTLESGVPLRVRGPDRPVLFEAFPETFKDTVFLLLANAGRWGEGKTVDLILSSDDEWIRLTVADRGPGFSHQALDRAFDPFWTSDGDALGLGLTQARQLAQRMGGDVTLGNRDEGGGAVTLTLPRVGPASS